MAAPDLKTLAKTFHLNITGVTKKQIVQMLIKKSQQSSISSMFKGGGNVSTEKTMVTRWVKLEHNRCNNGKYNQIELNRVCYSKVV